MSAAAIIAIIDVAFVVLLGLGFLEGFLRGVKRSSLEIGLTVAGIIIVALITPVVTNAVLNINVSGGTLQDMIMDALKSNEDIASVLDSSSSSVELINKLPVLIVSAVAFLLLNLAMRSIVYIAYKLLSLCFKSKKKEKELGLKRNRWAGGLISTLKMFVLVLVMFMPLTSLTKLADQVIPEQSNGAVSAAVEDEGAGSTDDESTGSGEEDGESTDDGEGGGILVTIKNVVHGVNKSAFGVINGVGNMDDLMLDGVSKIEINGEKISLRREINNYITLYQNVSSIINAEDLSKVDWEAMDKAYEEVTTNPLYNDVVLNIVGELITDYPTIVRLVPSLEEYQGILQCISQAISTGDVEVDFNFAEYFKPDIDKIYYTISGAGKSGYLAEVVGKESLLDSITILVQKYDAVLTAAVNNVFDINMVQDAISPALSVAFDKIATDPKLAEIFDDAKTEITDFDALKTQVKSVIVSVGNINGLLKAQNVAIGDVTSDVMVVLKLKQNTSVILAQLGGMLDAIDGLEFMQNTKGEKLLPKVLETYEIGDLKDVKGESIETYKDTFEFVGPSIEKLASLDLYDDLSGESVNFNSILKKIATKLVSEKTETTYSTFMSDTLLPLYKATVFKDKIFPMLIDGSKGTGVVDFSLLEVENDWAASYMNWAGDLPHITIVITEFESKQYSDTQTMLDYLLTDGADMNEVVKKLDDETIDKVMPSILTAKSLQPLRDQLAGIVVDSINGLTKGTATMTLDTNMFTGEDSQTDEFKAIIKTFVKIYNSSTKLETIDDVDSTLLGQLLNQMKANAYRKEISGKEINVGVTRALFDALVAKLETEYDIDLADVFNKQVYEVDFAKLIDFIDEANAKNAFAEKFKYVAIDGNKTTADVDALMAAVKDNQDSAKAILTLANEMGLDASLDESEKTYFSGKIDELAKDTDIDAEIIAQFRQLIGETA